MRAGGGEGKERTVPTLREQPDARSAGSAGRLQRERREARASSRSSSSNASSSSARMVSSRKTSSSIMSSSSATGAAAVAAGGGGCGCHRGGPLRRRPGWPGAAPLAACRRVRLSSSPERGEGEGEGNAGREGSGIWGSRHCCTM